MNKHQVKVPDLEPHCGSWIVTSPTGAVAEFFTFRNAQLAHVNGWKVQTAAKYLGQLPRNPRDF